MEDDLLELLVAQQVSCRVWPEQTEGPYHRDVHPERRDITEDREGLPLRVGLRLLDAETGDPLAGVAVDVWQADHEGRYSGFRPFRARPGQVVTSATVPRDVVAPSETFLRGRQRTDDRGMCAFDTIYPGWYSSRTVHIHLTAQLGDQHAITQLYFPDELTDEVFARRPYAGRDPRDTTNATDSIFVDGGKRTVLQLVGDAVDGLTAVLCMAIESHPAPPAPAGPNRGGAAEMASVDQLRAAVEAHVAAVGAADAVVLAALYAPDGRLHDPAGGQPIVGRAAIADHFSNVLSKPREMQIVTIVVAGHDAAVHFRPTPGGCEPRDIIDTMTFDDQHRFVWACLSAVLSRVGLSRIH